MTFIHPDQQPIARTVGRRTRRPLGMMPPAEARAALNAWSKHLKTCMPKGVFRYATHDEMERDRNLWRVQAIVETIRARG